MCFKTAVPLENDLNGYFKKQTISQGKVFEIRPYPQYYHADGFDMPQLPVTTIEEPRIVQPAMWKLIPSWVKTTDEARRYANTLNATCEEIFEKPSYKNYIGSYRALLWVSGFFESQHVGKKINPYFIYAADGDPFTMGCVYSNWLNNDTGEVLKTFSIITTPANKLMAEIHNVKRRMPLIIPDCERDRWVSDLKIEGIKEMMKPISDGFLKAHRVGNLIYQKGVDTNKPEAQKLFIEPVQTLF